MTRVDCIVVGAGAAGVFAAARARQARPDRSVLILEAQPRSLSKLLISGGGRCNVTHQCTDLRTLLQAYPRGHRELGPVLRRFMPQDTVQWFTRRGVALKTEPDGRMFPVSDRSQTIAECLLQELGRLQVNLRNRCQVREVRVGSEGFLLQTSQGPFQTDRLLLATGSSPRGYEWARSLGHSLVPPVPSLFTFTVEDPRLLGLWGVSVTRVRATLRLDPPIVQEGPLLITHWGMSGPVILKLSAWGARALHALGYRATLRVDWLPGTGHDELHQWLRGHKQSSRKTVGNHCPVGLPRRLWEALAEADGIGAGRPFREVPDRSLNRLGEHLKACDFEIRGKGAFKEEFVTAGGIPLGEVDLSTMQSKVRPGLFFAGEILDVDALTGGYNFQNAWATGWVAGEAMGTAEGV